MERRELRILAEFLVSLSFYDFFCPKQQNPFLLLPPLSFFHFFLDVGDAYEDAESAKKKKNAGPRTSFYV